MKNLVRSQLYSLRKEIKLLLIVLTALTLACWMTSALSSGELMFADDNYDMPKLSASVKFGLSAGTTGLYGEVFILIAVGLFMSRDMNDKTINYEIMNGHGRKHIFFSRAIVSMGVGVVGALLMFLLIPVIDSIRFGWGNEIPLATAIGRTCIMILLFCRVSAELIFMAAVFRKTYLVYIIGFLLGVLELAAESFSESKDFLFAVSAPWMIFDFQVFPLYHLDETWTYYIDGVMTAEMILRAVLPFLAASGLSLFYGYRFFEAADLD